MGLSAGWAPFRALGGPLSERCNQDAQAVVEGAFKGQNAFESTLLDQALAIDLVTTAQEQKLRTILKTRHLCGHPSGHIGSPEEARGAIAAMVDTIMSQPALLGMHAVEDILARVSNANFFPKLDDAAVRSTLAAELKVVSTDHYPALVARLVAQLGQVKGDPIRQRTAIQNHVAALGAAIGTDALRVEVWRRLEKLLGDPAADTVCLPILAKSDAQGLKTSPPLNHARAVALVRRNLLSEHAQAALRSWRSGSALDKTEEQDIASAGRELALTKTPGADLTAAVFDIGPVAYEPYLARLAEAASSSRFDTANPAISAMQALTDEQASKVTEQQQIDYLKGIAAHDGKRFSAVQADALLKHGLGARTPFGQASAKRLETEPDLIDHGRGLERLLRSSGLNSEADAIKIATEAAGAALAQKLKNLMGRAAP